jgi:amino acid transporter
MLLFPVTLIVAAEHFMDGAAFSAFVLGGVLVAAVTTLNITYTLVTRAMLAIARDGLVPATLGRLDPRTGTPTAAIAVAWKSSRAR